ncbi:MAG: DoxX family protein [Bacteroidales bacterium]|nr:DoxX family protein [Bacteroidales bacterium]
MKIHMDFRRIFAWILGLVFVYSGISKLMDPVGTSYIMKEYFHFLHLSFLDGAALTLGVLFSLFEAVLGIALTTGIFRRITVWATGIVLFFFLVLTFALLIVNPTMDCGCFGESTHLSHFDTFAKNVVLILLAVCAWAGKKHFGQPKLRKYFAAGISLTAVLIFTLVSLMGLPLRDYTDYADGNKLLSADPYATLRKTRRTTMFYYEKDSVKQGFDRPVRPDSSWRFAGMKQEIRAWDEPAADLPLHDSEGVTVDGLLIDGPVMVVSLYEKPGEKKWGKVCQFARDAQAAGFSCVVVASERYYNDFPLYLSDAKTLSTFNRSNGGVTYLYDGEIIAKWSYAFRPDKQELEEMMQKDYVEILADINGARERRMEGFSLFLLAVLLLI